MMDMESDAYLLALRRERWARRLALGGVVVGVVGLLSAGLMLPLKHTETVVVVVDKATGDMDRAVKMAPLAPGERDALIQAHLVSYVDDRETYDLADSEIRINEVLKQSEGDAARTLRNLWSSGNKNYPPAVYGKAAKIDVTVKRVNILKEGVAQVMFTKTLRDPRSEGEITRSYSATLGYRFEPEKERRVSDVWLNPLGFEVLSYRVDAELVEGKE